MLSFLALGTLVPRYPEGSCILGLWSLKTLPSPDTCTHFPNLSLIRSSALAEAFLIFARIGSGTTEIEKNPGVNELFKLAHSKDVSLVRLCDLSWNQIELSLILIYEKLVDLGFENYNGKVEINEIETEGSSYHA